MPPKRQGRPPVVADARNRILDDAASLFARSGYDGTSVDEIAEAVGLTKAAIYHYFSNKKDIYEGIIVRTLDGLLAEVEASVSGASDPAQALSNFMQAHAEFFEARYDGFLTLLVGYGGMRNVTMISKAQKLRDEYEAILRRIIARGVASRKFRRVDVAVTSRAILSMLNWMVRWYMPGGRRKASAFAKEYYDLVMHGLRI